MTICGIIGWLPATGRPELRVYHSRISQCMAAPVQGAFKAAYKIIKYLALNKDLCLHQLWGADSDAFEWRFYSDSDQSSNVRTPRSRTSSGSSSATSRYVDMRLSCSDPRQAQCTSEPTSMASVCPTTASTSPRTCHPDMSNIHADVSSAAAEVYAASVALSELPS